MSNLAVICQYNTTPLIKTYTRSFINDPYSASYKAYINIKNKCDKVFIFYNGDVIWEWIR